MRSLVSRLARVALGASIAGAILGHLVIEERIAHADDDVQAFARVIVADAELRAGPGASYRVIATAHRGETLALDGRQGEGFWLRVLLEDGRLAYALGDELAVFSVDPNAGDGPSRPGIFAPPPLQGTHGGLAIVGGIFRSPITGSGTESYGYMELRPSIVVSPNLSIDGFVGDALTSDGSQLLYGGGVSMYLAPRWAVCPFVDLGLGGYSVIPTTDSFVLKREDLLLGRAGGGFLLALRNRILVRVEATEVTLFSTSSYKNAQTYPADWESTSDAPHRFPTSWSCANCSNGDLCICSFDRGLLDGQAARALGAG